MLDEKRIIVLTKESNVRKSLEKQLEALTVVHCQKLEELNGQIQKGGKPVAIVIHLKTSEDWMALEFIQTSYPGIPRFAILEKTQSNEEVPFLGKYETLASFNKDNLKGLAALIRLSANTSYSSPNQNASFMMVFSDLSKELQRLNGEFTETALRTLPQPKVGADTEERLKNLVATLKTITIAP